jgi:hypothetical protein
MRDARGLDPRTAHANWAYANLGDEENPCTGRAPYWFDPDLPGAFSDAHMRDAWPEFHETWQEL